MTQIQKKTLKNGLVLLAEPIAGVRSLAVNLLTPAGLVAQPPDREGVAPLLAEMVFRGAGGQTAREHSDAMDRLGMHRSADAGGRFLRFGATLIGDKMADALPLFFDLVCRPTLDDASLEPARDLALQAIAGLDDEPQQRAMIELGAKHYPAPLGRSGLGIKAHIQAMTGDDVRAFWKTWCVPNGSILSFAGAFDFDTLCDVVEQETASWSGKADYEVACGTAQGGYHHLSAESTQVHIGVAFDAVPVTHADRTLQSAAVAVLSGGMSGRLFTEVREKRGLCYSVYARYAGQKDRGDITAYAGTTAPRAQETLDVLTAELRRLAEGVDEGEFRRAVVGMKSRLVMQGESSGARASSIAANEYLFGAPKTLAQDAAEVDALTLDALNDFVKRSPAGKMTVVTLGPEPLTC
ncbi:MAG: pitrilysin family protein [Algisphaera sp.]